MSNFSAEIFDPGLLQGGRSSQGQRVGEVASGAGDPHPSPPLKPGGNHHSKNKSIVYRIFHLGDSTPTGSDSEDQFIIGKSRAYGSGSESDCNSDGEHDTFISLSNPLVRSGSTHTHTHTHEGPLSRKSSFSDIVMDQFRNATKSLGREASRKKKHGIFSQNPEESSDYESEDNHEAYKEYVKKGKSRSSVSLLKDFLHFSSSSKSKQGSLSPLSPVIQQQQPPWPQQHHQNPPRSPITNSQLHQPQHRTSNASVTSIFGPKQDQSSMGSSVVFSPVSVPQLRSNNGPQTVESSSQEETNGHQSGNQSTLERHPSPGDSSFCSSSTTPPIHPSHSLQITSKFKDLILPQSATAAASSTGFRRASMSSHKSIGSIDDTHIPGHGPSRSSSELSLKEKYGNLSNVLGKGAFATVKLCCPVGGKEKYAVKEFRKKKKEESTKEYIKKLQAEFCIASSMENENIVKCVDLIQDSKRSWCVVMEFCKDGDLFARISNGSLISESEKSCYFVQLVRGVAYLHSIGVAHRDLKPENILLQGSILKITDFGVSTVFKNPFGAKREKQKGITGSGPYIAPEEWTEGEYDSELVDIWAIGIIGYVMASNSIPWRCAQPTDTRFRLYIESHKKFAPFERIHPGLRKLMYRILEPDPVLRISMKEIVADDWLSSVEVCTTANLDKMIHTHTSHGPK